MKQLKPLLPYLGFFLLVLISRSLFLMKFPMYLDEGIYISWAKLVATSSNYAYVSLNDGKTPLFMWLVASVASWFPSILVAGRAVSALAGAVTAVTWLAITEKLFGQKFRSWFMILALIAPYTFFVERMAFVDSLLTMFASLAFLTWILARDFFQKDERGAVVKGWLFSGLTGLSLALGYMTKTSGKLFLVIHLVLAGVWIVQFLLQRKFKNAVWLVIGTGLMAGVYRELLSYLRTGASRFWGGILSKEVELTFTPSEIIHNLTTQPQMYLSSVYTAGSYYVVYLLGILILVVAALVYLWSIRQKIKKQPSVFLSSLWVVIYLGIIIVGSLLAGRVTSSRYFYPAVPALISLAAVGGWWLWNSKQKIAKYLAGLSVVITAGAGLFMMVNPLYYPIATNEISFTHGDISALGLPEVIDSVDKENSIIAVTGIWGVKDGSVIVMKEYGIEAFGVDQVWSKSEPMSGKCAANEALAEGSCYRLNVDHLLKSDKQYKLLYLTDGGSKPEIMKQIPGVTVVKEFQRPSEFKTYLLRVETP